ncbi:hypothetical protein [Bacillus subtilis]|uniref:hypothetical protein n=1 Tax=Bacillus subtilis TaxID=1423 RepID=UPI002DBA3C1B|nr:hypothetical protein [Bacillus subtilis]MEC4030270.1 hypothetical protein [Bacillus subtilis]
MELPVILEALHSQLRIVNCKSEPINQVESGQVIALEISPWFSQYTTYIEKKGDVKLEGMSPMEGTIPVAQGVPLSIEVIWIVKDEQGNVAQEGIDYLPLGGLQGLNTSLVFIPKCFVEYTSDPSSIGNGSTKNYSIEAFVTIKAGNEKFAGNLPPVSFSVLPIFIPTVFAVCNEKYLSPIATGWDDAGRALIMVPPNSPVRSKDDLISIVKKLKEKINILSAISDFSFLKLGLDILYNILKNNKNIQFSVETKFKLNTIAIPDPTGMKTWENTIRSFIFVGVPGSSVNCYINKNNPDHGVLELLLPITNRTCYALSRRLDSKKPDSEPFNSEITIKGRPIRTFEESIDYVEIVKPAISPKCF